MTVLRHDNSVAEKTIYEMLKVRFNLQPIQGTNDCFRPHVVDCSLNIKKCPHRIFNMHGGSLQPWHDGVLSSVYWRACAVGMLSLQYHITRYDATDVQVHEPLQPEILGIHMRALTGLRRWDPTSYMTLLPTAEISQVWYHQIPRTWMVRTNLAPMREGARPEDLKRLHRPSEDLRGELHLCVDFLKSVRLKVVLMTLRCSKSSHHPHLASQITGVSTPQMRFPQSPALGSTVKHNLTDISNYFFIFQNYRRV